MLRAGKSGVGIPTEAEDFPLLQNVEIDSWTHPAGASSPNVKRPDLQADHSPPSSTELKNYWSFDSPLCVRGLWRHRFTFCHFYR